jgi:hypothetical protein
MTHASIPDQIEDPKLSDYLEVMTRAVFQAGLSWATIAQRWEAFREAFDGFDAMKVAAYTEGDVDRLLHAPGILHSARKIRATVHNAQVLTDLDRSYGGFEKYLASFASYPELSADIKRRFKFMGEMNVWYFLFRVRRPVPTFEKWVTTIPGDHPRMKEMVERARAAGTSTER